MPHPFNFAYSVQSDSDRAVIQQLFDWTVTEYGIHAPAPSIMVVNHEHMQRAASRSSTGVEERKHVLGWYARGNRAVYLSDKVRPSKRISCAGIVVHEIVHYLQDIIGHCWDVVMMEEEADWFMMKYVSSPLILTRF